MVQLGISEANRELSVYVKKEDNSLSKYPVYSQKNIFWSLIVVYVSAASCTKDLDSLQILGRIFFLHYPAAQHGYGNC